MATLNLQLPPLSPCERQTLFLGCVRSRYHPNRATQARTYLSNEPVSEPTRQPANQPTHSLTLSP